MTPCCSLPRARAPHADVIEPRRVRLRDRVQARLRANRLDRALAEGVPPERSVALALRARRLVEPAVATTLARAIQRVLRDAWHPEPMPGADADAERRGPQRGRLLAHHRRRAGSSRRIRPPCAASRW